MEQIVRPTMQAAKQAITSAEEALYVEGQNAAQEQLVNLTVESARLIALKAVEKEELSQEKQFKINPTIEEEERVTRREKRKQRHRHLKQALWMGFNYHQMK